LLSSIDLKCDLVSGPHKEGEFHEWLTEEFRKRGWHLELQAPQGPYTNVLELQVFPAMSKKHSELLQILSNTQADTERIWKIALEIWRLGSHSFIIWYIYNISNLHDTAIRIKKNHGAHDSVVFYV
jgi:hypothetical protein